MSAQLSTQPKTFKLILAVESSCDETACAIVELSEDGQTVSVVAETTASSLSKHKETKGIVPEVAAREQLKSILPVLQHTLDKAHISTSELNKKIDALAVTVRPGLIGSLLVGVEAIRTLAYRFDLPIIPVNHIQAHPYANFIQPDPHSTIHIPHSIPQFPLLSWVISGGHTELYLMRSHQEVIHLGGTIDDAAGECFDKCARVLGFDYPGGPYIDQLAQEFQQPTTHLHAPTSGRQAGNQQLLPRPLLHSGDYRLSFSGLKTAFARLHKEMNNHQSARPDQQEAGEQPTTDNREIAYELQSAISEVIAKKTQLALEEFPEVQSVIISGGAAANTGIRSALEKLTTNHQQLTTFFPPLKWCTDNAAMIGAYALFHPEEQTNWQEVAAMPRG